MKRFPALRSVLALAATGLLLAPLTACSMGGASQMSSAPLTGPMSQVPDAAFDSSFEGGPVSPTAQVERSIIRSGDMAIEVADPASSADEVEAIVQKLGGSVESVSVQELNSTPAAQLTVRVPANDLATAFTDIGAVGTVISESRSALDVTTEHVDLQAKVDSLETSVARLQELMSGSATTSDLLEAESALSQRQQELDGLRAQLKSLEGQVSEATITVWLTSPSALPGGGPSNFWEGLLTGFGSLGVAGSGALVLFGILLPWLVVAGVIAVVVVWIVRRSRRRSRERRALVAHSTAAPVHPPLHSDVNAAAAPADEAPQQS